MSDHSRKRRGVESDAGRDVATESVVVRRRHRAVEPLHRAENDHDGAEARGQELDLQFRVAPGRQHTLAELEELSHGFVLDLQAQMRTVDRDSVERGRAEQDAVPLENVRVLHGEDVGAAAPLGAR